jgi:RimJ/RimL family protein N-acetyltransferase
MVVELETSRLRLRGWLPADAERFTALNADPRVVEYLPGPISRGETHSLIERIEGHFREHGFGLWAVKIPGVTEFAGYVGLSVPRFDALFTPCVEVSWRLAHGYWGQGYATEGAQAVTRFGFDTLMLSEIVSFTVPQNLRSRRVMERIGMSHDPTDDFDHPGLPVGHPLRPHVLYRLRRQPPPNSGLQQTPVSRSIGRRS